jgi:indole-3-glycerol phosphate synthase
VSVGDRYRQEAERVRRAVTERLKSRPESQLIELIEDAQPVRSLAEALSHDELALIVEPKRATATRGEIDPALDVASVARAAEHAGARALSVVTEPTFSNGRVGDLARARGACDLPLLARDFIVHTGQVYELRAAGADALLLPMFIFSSVEDDEERPDVLRLSSIVSLAYSLGMDVVPSVQDEQQLERALDLDIDILNIDNRGSDERIDVERTFDMLAEVPVGTTVISESVADAREVSKLHRAGVDALLLDEGHLEGDLYERIEMFARLSSAEHGDGGDSDS